MRTYRNGAAGALADEYQRAVNELDAIVKNLTVAEYVEIRDATTTDKSCRSIQTIVSHVVGAGYNYARMFRLAWGQDVPVRERPLLDHSQAASSLAAMLDYTWDTLDGRWQLSEADAMALEIKAGWGQVYDFEQLFEHAIVHVLRHRRQVERFLQRD